MRSYDALGTLLEQDHEALAQCRDFGLRIGLDEDSPEWAYFVMPILTRRFIRAEIAEAIPRYVRDALHVAFEDNALGQQVLEGTRAAVREELDEHVKKSTEAISTAVAESISKAFPEDVDRLLKATNELLIALKSSLDASAQRDSNLAKLPDQVEALIAPVKAILKKKTLLDRIFARGT